MFKRWMFYFSVMIRNEKTDVALDNLLGCGIDSGIKEITSSNSAYVNIVFNNGNSVMGWNVNRYYAWFSQGVFCFASGTEYSWQDGMPTRKTMYDLLQAIKSVK